MTWPRMQLWKGSIRAGGGPGVRGKHVSGRKGPAGNRRLFLNSPSALANISCPHSGSFSLVPTAFPGTALTPLPFPNVFGISGISSVPAPVSSPEELYAWSTGRHRDGRLSLALQAMEPSWGTRHAYSPKPNTWVASGQERRWKVGQLGADLSKGWEAGSSQCFRTDELLSVLACLRFRVLICFPLR